MAQMIMIQDGGVTVPGSKMVLFCAILFLSATPMTHGHKTSHVCSIVLLEKCPVSLHMAEVKIKLDLT